ncbi:Acyl carrier protein [Alphaproteobacteria bacterium]
MNVTANTIEHRVRNLIAEKLDLDPEKVKLEASFTEDLGADSLDLVELTMAFEEEFKIEIPDAAAEKIKLVRDAVGAIQNILKEDGSPTPST